MELNNKNIKKSLFKAQFNSLEINQEDPTLLRGKVVIHDFLPSWNKQGITEEICAENMSTLIGKRIVCKYIPCEDNNGIDALTDHEDKIGQDRNTGNEKIVTDTIAIGFIESVYIDDYTDEEGNTKRVLYGNVIIWNDDKYSNIVGLLQEWINRGVKIHMSVEYLYMNYNMIDGIEWLQSPILYVAHTLLNSEQRGEYAEILPAYDVATLVSLNERQQWNKAINQLSKINNISDKSENNINSDLSIKTINKKEENLMENIFLKSLNNLSFGDIRDKIYTELAKVMTADLYNYVWISTYDIFDEYFIYETRIENEWVVFKVPYTKSENDEVVIMYDQQTKAEFKGDWVSVAEMTVVQNSLNETKTELGTANSTIANLQSQLNAKDETIKSLNSKVESTAEEKKVTIEKFNDLAETVTSLNSQVKILQPLADKYNQEQYEKSLNAAKDYYKEKFENIDGIDIFEKEDTQELIKKSINSNAEESQKAKFALNDLIINNLKPIESKTQVSLNSVQLAKGTKNLTEVVDEFEERYGFKRD